MIFTSVTLNENPLRNTYPLLQAKGKNLHNIIFITDVVIGHFNWTSCALTFHCCLARAAFFYIFLLNHVTWSSIIKQTVPLHHTIISWCDLIESKMNYPRMLRRGFSLTFSLFKLFLRSTDTKFHCSAVVRAGDRHEWNMIGNKFLNAMKKQYKLSEMCSIANVINTRIYWSTSG